MKNMNTSTSTASPWDEIQSDNHSLTMLQLCLRSSSIKNTTNGLVIYFERGAELLCFEVQIKQHKQKV